MIPDLLDYLDEIEDLPAPMYRTAVRLARLTQNGSVVLSYDELRSIVGTNSDSTARAHLIRLHKAGLLWFRRNKLVCVAFYDLATRATRAYRASDDQCDRDTRAEGAEIEAKLEAPRASDDQYDRDTRAEGAEIEAKLEAPRASDDQYDRDTRETRATRSQRASGDHYKGRLVGRLVGGSNPTYLPGGAGGDGGLSPEEARTVTLLTDPDFGMDSPTALAVARQFPFEQVRAHAFAVLEDVRAGKVRSIYVLPSRLKRGGMPKILENDRRSELWLRHASASDMEDDLTSMGDELRRKYIPPGYEGVIIG